MLRSVCHKRDYRSHLLSFLASSLDVSLSLALCPLDVLSSVLALWTFVRHADDGAASRRWRGRT